MLTLGNVLDESGFGLRLLTGPDTVRLRTVAGAHNSETPTPSRFLPPDWLMLTLGLNLRRNPDGQRALIAELDDAGVCALGFGVGVAFERPPRALLAEAGARGFPVFTIPYDTPYREIVGYVNRSLLSSDFHTLHRSLSMQNYLMDALRADDPVGRLVQRLGHLLQSTVLLFDHRGTLEAASGDAPVDSIWAGVRTTRPSLQRALVAGSDIVSVPIGDDTARRWLVVASRSRALPSQLVMSVIQSAERLLDVVSLSRRAAAAEDRIVQAELLASALKPLAGYDLVELAARVRRFGLDFTRPARVVVFAPDGTGGGAGEGVLERARQALEGIMADDAAPVLMASRKPRIVALAQVEPARIGGWLERLESRHGLCFVAGVGGGMREIADAPQSFRGADTALRQRGGPLRLFDDLGLASWLADNVPAQDLAAKVAAVLGGLAGQPQLRETLLAYLRENMNVAATARALNVHHNTLRYRLGRIEEALGRSLRDLPTLVDLYIAVLSAGGGPGEG